MASKDLKMSKQAIAGNRKHELKQFLTNLEVVKAKERLSLHNSILSAVCDIKNGRNN